LAHIESPTIHQVRQTYDTIVAQAANPIFGKLQFYVIISSAIEPKLQILPIRIADLWDLPFFAFLSEMGYL